MVPAMSHRSPRRDHGRVPEPSRRVKQLLHEVNSRIALMEVVLGNLHRNATAGREADRERLRSKLSACYVVRKALERRPLGEARSLKELLQLAEIRLEHRRFEPFGAVQPDEYEGVDFEDLEQRLFGT